MPKHPRPLHAHRHYLRGNEEDKRDGMDERELEQKGESLCWLFVFTCLVALAVAIAVFAAQAAGL